MDAKLEIDWRLHIPETRRRHLRAWLWTIAGMTFVVLVVGGITRLTLVPHRSTGGTAPRPSAALSGRDTCSRSGRDGSSPIPTGPASWLARPRL